MSVATDFADVLEELRVEFLGIDAAIDLLKNGDTGFDTITTVERSFYLKRTQSVAIGEEFILLKVAEQTGVNDETVGEIIAARYLGTIYKASVIDKFINAKRIVEIRLTDETK